jgi:hypothetical protein
MSFDYDSCRREYDFRHQEEQGLRGLVTSPTRVSIPSSKNGTLVWLMSNGTFTVRVLKTEYDGPPVPIQGPALSLIHLPGSGITAILSLSLTTVNAFQRREKTL